MKHIEILKDKPAFKSKYVGGRAFTKDRQAYGFDGPVTPKKYHETKLNIYKHDNPFRPSNPNKSVLFIFLNKNILCIY